MTVRVSDKAGLVRCLEIIRDGVEDGTVAGFSVHHEASGISRVSIAWAMGVDEIPELPGIPEPDPDSTEETTKR